MERYVKMFVAICNKHLIRITGNNTVVSGSQKVHRIQFRFSDDWDNIQTKIVQFSNDKVHIISIQLDDHYIVDIPWEVLATPKLPVFVGVYGIGEDGVRLPTLWGNLCQVSIGVPAIGNEGKAPTPDYFDKLEKIVSEANKVGLSAYEVAVKRGFSGTETEWLSSLNGKDGADGKDGQNGIDGADGISPTISITAIAGGHRITITDKNGTNVFDVPNGANGLDGVSPTLSVIQIEGGHRVTIVDKNGTNTFDVMDGAEGTPADISGKLDKSEFTTFQNNLGNIMQGMEQQMYNPLVERVVTLEDKVGDGYEPVDISGKLDKSEFTTFQNNVTTRLTAVETNKVDKTKNEERWSNLELLFQALDQQILTPLSNRVTAIEGADYLTQADQQAIVEAVISALPDASEVSY